MRQNLFILLLSLFLPLFISCASTRPPTLSVALATIPIPTTLAPTSPPPTHTSGQPTPSNAKLTFGVWYDLFYHPILQKTLLVNGGPETDKNPNDPIEIWEWTGTTWQLFDASGPRWRNFASIAFDTRRNVLVLYGGLQNDTTQFAETWEWNGSQWTQIDFTGPGNRESAAMTFDPTQNKILLFGGAQNAKMMNDVWQYDGTTWERSNAQGPTARFPGAFLFAPQQNGILLFGGHAVDNRGFKTYGDTWLLQNNTWQRLATDGPSPRDGARAAQNPNSQNILLFGGANVTSTVTYLDDTWIWDGAKWQALQVAAPPARLHHAMVYDAKHNRIVLVGGANKPGTTILQDVWEWDGSAWHCVYMCP